MFENITAAPADPILGLADLFRADDRPGKINLGIGVYKDETGKTPVLTSVKKAEQYLLENETTKNYLGIDGIPEFGRCTQELLFGKGSTIVSEKRARTAQTPGGTGALRVAADFLAKNTSVKRVWVSNPSWPNHKSVFNSAGLEVREYAYYDAANHALDFDGLLASLSEAQAGDVVLFHGCCHNPTGIDPTLEQWEQLAKLSVEKGWLPLFDFAYQGFGDGLEEDAWAVRLFAETLPEMLITSSCSKNFGLYRERTGALIAVTSDAERLLDVRSQLASLARNLWSTPPAHGAAVVATILADEPLRQIWQDEVERMRRRIASLRQGLVEALTPYGLAERFAHIARQRGMFSYTGLTAEQVRRLRAEDSVYLVESGRANVAGLDAERLDDLARAIARVVQG